MAEVDVSGDLVHAYPPDLAGFLRQGRKLLDRRAVGLDRRMAGHAGGGGCDSHNLPRIGIRMTPLALQLQITGVNFVAEWNRLLGRGRNNLPFRLSGRLPDAEGRAQSEAVSPRNS